jgi:hypothetical protein
MTKLNLGYENARGITFVRVTMKAFFLVVTSLIWMLCSRRSLTLLGVGILTACSATPLPRPDEGQVSLQNETILPRGRLINEGGVVFAVPGEVRFPAYFAGDPSELLVRGEQLNGNRLPQFATVPLDRLGNFQFLSRIETGFYVISVEFNHEQRRHTMRAMVKGDANDPVIVDAVSSMLAARVQMAARQHDNLRLDYREVADLTERARELLGPDLNQFRFDQSQENMVYQFDALAQPYAVLGSDWREFTTKLLRDRPMLNPSLTLPERSESPPDATAK